MLLILIGPTRQRCTTTKVELKSTHYSDVSFWFSLTIVTVLNLEELKLSKKIIWTKRLEFTRIILNANS
jgi:hypothetical protein